MDKTYLGQRLAQFTPGMAHRPITRVNLLDSNGDLLHTAGNDEGGTLEAVNPDATQAMAEAILSSVQGFTYRPYEGQDAVLDPAAELGDGITVGGTYSLLGRSDTTFDLLTTSEIGAPAGDEIDDEYPYRDPIQKLIQRNIQSVRSFITKTATEINMTVEDQAKQLGTTLRIGLDGVVITDAKGTPVTISGGQVDAATIRAQDLDASQINAGQLKLTGVLSWADFSSAGQDELLEETTQAATTDITTNIVPGLEDRIQASKDRADDAYDIAWEAESFASEALDKADDAYILAEETSDEFASVKKVSGGKTYLDGSKIYSSSIYTDALHLGGSMTVYSTKTGTTIGGYLGYTTSANDGSAGMHMMKGSSEVVVTASGAKLTYNGTTNQVYVSNNNVGFVAGGNYYYMGTESFRPGAGFNPLLGNSSNLWGQIYSTNAAISTSDRNEKKNITKLNSKILDFVLQLNPVSYKFKTGTRKHFGLIAQDVEEVMNKLGMTSNDFAGFCKDEKTQKVKKTITTENGEEREIEVDEIIPNEYIYGLRYEEFIAPLIKVVQMQQKEIEELKKKVG